MSLLATRSNTSEFLLILLIFILVLLATYFVTKWSANYQKNKGSNANIELKDAAQLGNNKYVQVVRVGEKYFALAVCKDTVTLLGEIPGEQLKDFSDASQGASFKEILAKISKKQLETDGESMDEPEPENDSISKEEADEESSTENE